MTFFLLLVIAAIALGIIGIVVFVAALVHLGMHMRRPGRRQRTLRRDEAKPPDLENPPPAGPGSPGGRAGLRGAAGRMAELAVLASRFAAGLIRFRPSPRTPSGKPPLLVTSVHRYPRRRAAWLREPPPLTPPDTTRTLRGLHVFTRPG